jgi:sphingolipid C9-methyltransferase
MNKYVFPGADASCALGWVVNQVEAAGFELKNIDVLGVHYSATLWRWYKNWLNNKEKVVEKYGERWFRVWSFFLAYSVIISRFVFRIKTPNSVTEYEFSQGGCSVFQLTMHKNLNAYHRIEGALNHASIKVDKPKDLVYVCPHLT